MSVSGNLATEQRLTWIQDRLDRDAEIRISEAAEHLGVSDMTVRRDLEELEALGTARRVRGGAVAIGPMPFADRHRLRAKAKSLIAAKVIDLLPTSGTIGIDASSTMLRVAAGLEQRSDQMVFTNGWDTFQTLKKVSGITSVLTGGHLDSRTGSLVGPVACRAVSHVRLDTLVMSAAGVDEVEGPSEPTLAEGQVKKAMADMADEVVVAVDSTKLGVRSIARTVSWDDVNWLVTDLDPADHRLDGYRDRVAIR